MTITLPLSAGVMTKSYCFFKDKRILKVQQF